MIASHSKINRRDIEQTLFRSSGGPSLLDRPRVHDSQELSWGQSCSEVWLQACLGQVCIGEQVGVFSGCFVQTRQLQHGVGALAGGVQVLAEWLVFENVRLGREGGSNYFFTQGEKTD